MRISFDMGGVIADTREEGVYIPGMVELIADLGRKGHDVLVCSKVASPNNAIKRWRFLLDNEFFERTGVHPQNVVMCHKRNKYKSLVYLDARIHIDDRYECLKSCPGWVDQIKFGPTTKRDEEYKTSYCSGVWGKGQMFPLTATDIPELYAALRKFIPTGV